MLRKQTLRQGGPSYTEQHVDDRDTNPQVRLANHGQGFAHPGYDQQYPQALDSQVCALPYLLFSEDQCIVSMGFPKRARQIQDKILLNQGSETPPIHRYVHQSWSTMSRA